MKGTPPEAARWFRRASELYARAGAPDDAVRCARDAGDPALLGRTLAAVGRHPEAAAALERAALPLEAAPEWLRACEGGRAAAAFAAGGAHADAAEALLAIPGRAEAARVQAELAAAAGGREMARALALLGAALHRLGRDDEAEERLARAEEAASLQASALEAVAVAAALGGRPDRAALAFARARRLLAGREEALERLEARWERVARDLGNATLGATLASLRARPEEGR